MPGCATMRHARCRGAGLRRGHTAVRDRRPAPGGVRAARQRAGAAECRSGKRAARQRPRVPSQTAAGGGIVPQLAACAVCGETEHLRGFSGAAGGVVCGSCEAASFNLDEDAYRFLVGALGSSLARGPRRRRAGVAPGRARDLRDRRASRARAAAAAAGRLSGRFSAARSHGGGPVRAPAALSESLCDEQPIRHGRLRASVRTGCRALRRADPGARGADLSPLAVRSYPP